MEVCIEGPEASPWFAGGKPKDHLYNSPKCGLQCLVTDSGLYFGSALDLTTHVNKLASTKNRLVP